MKDWHVIICCLGYSQLGFYEVVQDNCSSHKCSQLSCCFSNAHTMYCYTLTSATSQLFSFLIVFSPLSPMHCCFWKESFIKHLEVTGRYIQANEFFFLWMHFLDENLQKRKYWSLMLKYFEDSSETFKLNVSNLSKMYTWLIFTITHALY